MTEIAVIIGVSQIVVVSIFAAPHHGVSMNDGMSVRLKLIVRISIMLDNPVPRLSHRKSWDFHQWLAVNYHQII